MGSEYSYLEAKAEGIKECRKQEEKRFFSTIEAGIELFKFRASEREDIFQGKRVAISKTFNGYPNGISPPAP